jgi:hypothetical protein
VHPQLHQIFECRHSPWITYIKVFVGRILQEALELGSVLPIVLAGLENLRFCNLVGRSGIGLNAEAYYLLRIPGMAGMAEHCNGLSTLKS